MLIIDIVEPVPQPHRTGVKHLICRPAISSLSSLIRGSGSTRLIFIFGHHKNLDSLTTVRPASPIQQIPRALPRGQSSRSMELASDVLLQQSVMLHGSAGRKQTKKA
jgi:hypothetical protein